MTQLKLTVTSGNGYSVKVLHYNAQGDVINERVYPFVSRKQAAGYVRDMHALYSAIGYAAQRVTQANVWNYTADDTGKTLLVDQGVMRIRLELTANECSHAARPMIFSLGL